MPNFLHRKKAWTTQTFTNLLRLATWRSWLMWALRRFWPTREYYLFDKLVGINAPGKTSIAADPARSPKTQDAEEVIRLETTESKEFDEFYQRTSRQIEREDGLVNQRLTWMLTFQGFLFTALAISASKDVAAIFRWSLGVALVFTGFFSARASLRGVKGAVRAVEQLKKSYDARVEQLKDAHAERVKQSSNEQAKPAAGGVLLSNWPRPYGDPNSARQGFTPMFGLPRLLMTVWPLLPVLTLGFAVLFEWESTWKPDWLSRLLPAPPTRVEFAVEQMEFSSHAGAVGRVKLRTKSGPAAVTRMVNYNVEHLEFTSSECEVPAGPAKIEANQRSTAIRVIPTPGSKGKVYLKLVHGAGYQIGEKDEVEIRIVP